MGFCVASTKNGVGNGREAPPTVTEASCMPSRSAGWVLGVARLISSASTMCAKSGPCWNWKRFRPPASSTIMFVPMMSAGMRSAVNSKREKDNPGASDSVLTSSVLPSPGTPSSSTWPHANIPMRTESMISRWPTITFSTSARSAWKALTNSCTRASWVICSPLTLRCGRRRARGGPRRLAHYMDDVEGLPARYQNCAKRLPHARARAVRANPRRASRVPRPRRSQWQLLPKIAAHAVPRCRRCGRQRDKEVDGDRAPASPLHDHRVGLERAEAIAERLRQARHTRHRLDERGHVGGRRAPKSLERAQRSYFAQHGHDLGPRDRQRPRSRVGEQLRLHAPRAD